MPYSPRNIRIACNHAGLTHYGGVYFFHEFLRALHLRHFLATHLTYPRRNSRYHLSQMVWVWLLWNDAPSGGIKTSLILFDVELPIAIKISREVDGSELDDGLCHQLGPAHA